MGAFATGVCVITTCHGDEVIGLTANSFTSVSLDPPLVLWCLDKRCERYDIFAGATTFDINILSSDQRDFSDRFARGDAAIGNHEGLLTLDHPLRLKKVIGWLSCTTYDTRAVGDHLVITGQVEAYDYGAGEGLTFFRGRYGQTHMFG
nr:flavin reductase family protein [Asticcacaulis machinosus]